MKTIIETNLTTTENDVETLLEVYHPRAEDLLL